MSVDYTSLMLAARSLLVVFAVAVVVGAGWFVWFRGGPAHEGSPEPPRTEAKPEPVGAKPVTVAVEPLPSPQSAGILVEDCIAYPDGTHLPPLNGVKKAPQIAFHRTLPFTKVVRKERDARTGLEWYVHENGARSTTRMMWRNGVQEAVGEVEMPAPTTTLIDEK